MRFILSRYLHAISHRKVWLLAGVVPALLFLAVAALLPARHHIEQEVQISQQAPLARTFSPIDFEIARRGASRDHLFFDDNLLAVLEARVDLGRVPTTELPLRLRRQIQRTMSLEWEGDDRLKIAYVGGDPDLGKVLVAYFSSALVTRSEEGRLRATSQPRSRSVEAGVLPASEPARLVGGLQQMSERRIWVSERLWPGLAILLVSMLVALTAIALIEWSDPAFKSERQVAQYLDIPLLGSIPDLDEVLKRLGSR